MTATTATVTPSTAAAVSLQEAVSPALKGAASFQNPLETLKAMVSCAKDTQGVHRAAIEADTAIARKHMELLTEQSRAATTAEEREALRLESSSTAKRHTDSVKEHKRDSNTVFQVLVGTALVLASGLAYAVGSRR